MVWQRHDSPEVALALLRFEPPGTLMAKRFSLVAALFVVLLPAVTWAQRSTTFGKDWVESHPFMITGWASAVANTGLFDGSGLNVVMSGSELQGCSCVLTHRPAVRRYRNRAPF